MLREGDEPCRGVDRGAEPLEPPDFGRHDCLSCMDEGYITLYDQGTDAVIGSRQCPEINNPMRHPRCGMCRECRWLVEHGVLLADTGCLSRPACTGPPPPQQPLCYRKCEVECAHNPLVDTDCPPF